MAEIGYVGNHGVHLQGSQDLNDPPAGAGSVAARRPYPVFGGVTLFSSEMETTYNSLQAKVSEPSEPRIDLSRGLHLVEIPAEQSFSRAGWQQWVRKDRFRNINIPQNFAFSMSYELPFGTGRNFVPNANGWVKAALGGWQIQNITVLRSGLAYTPIISRDVANTGVGSQRPIQIGSGALQHRTLNDWFNQAGFVLPAQYTYGTSKAFILEGDMYRQYDVSVFKAFPITEGSRLEFRAEFFNLPNVTSFNPPSLAANSTAAPAAAVDTSTGGKILSTSTNPRQIQFALKLYF